MEASGTTLTEIFGIGPILAAKIIGTGQATWCASRPQGPLLRLLLRYGAGGGLQRRGGAPQALAGRKPQALRVAPCTWVAICQARSDVRAKTYYRKKIAEGKSRKEALRCLKRRISDAVFKSLMADSQAPSRSAA